MDDTKTIQHSTINASPFKSFFVTMLTRDIDLDDAILDLLDNCIDGILRSKKLNGDKPYKKFQADILFDKDSFSISDNCGGIPWNLRDYAFRMGRAPKPDRPPSTPGSLGAYGIGMKRAIFKIGNQCLISSQNNDDKYEVDITSDWMRDENTWDLPVRKLKKSGIENGTTIVIGSLNDGIATKFSDDVENFTSGLMRKISGHYAFIIQRGFTVTINKEVVEPRLPKLIFDNTQEEHSIRPYIFRTENDGVKVFMTVGLTRPIPSQNELLEEQEGARYSSEDAGWTVLCNGRAVLYFDRSELTGWGESRVPRYHTQFIAISGIVEFNSDDSEKLPTTTTKRGIDATSPLYLQIKNKMREGMRLFTQFTNDWKNREKEVRDQMQGKPLFSFEEIKAEAQKLNFHKTTRTFPPGEQYVPKLPVPHRPEPTTRRIIFSKDRSKINTVASYYGDSDMDPSDVGEKCFDTIYEEARRK